MYTISFEAWVGVRSGKERSIRTEGWNFEKKASLKDRKTGRKDDKGRCMKEKIAFEAAGISSGFQCRTVRRVNIAHVFPTRNSLVLFDVHCCLKSYSFFSGNWPTEVMPV